MPSGTSGPTVGTAKPQKRAGKKLRGKFAPIVEMMRKMTSAEVLKLMVDAGIYTESGELTPHYQPKPPAKRKKKAG